MPLRDEILNNYTDEDGLILERPNSSDGPETGNGIENLCVYILLLHLFGELTLPDLNKFNTIIRSCEVDASLSDGFWSKRGLYNRGPRKLGDLIGHDDYVALSGVSSIVGAPFARDIFHRGSTHCWNFNNVNVDQFTFKSWQGRFFFSFVPFWKLCGGGSLLDIEKVMLCKYLEWSRTEAGPSILQWIMCRAIMGREACFDTAFVIWRANLFQRFPQGMRSVFSNYYKPSHPFAKYGPLF